MSATIATKDLKFVIFGSGHDYTRTDSGEGATQIFSHPSVPLNSVNYAGQYYFVVPDENGDPIDAVKDDIAHCTFDPAIGSTFDTEGETEVSVHYYREYIHDDETILVEKTVKQTITVVDHGTVANGASANYKRDIYTDGYCFIRPYPDNAVESTFYVTNSTNVNPILKVSSLPWRANSLGRNIEPFINGSYSTSVDLSELAFADVSNVTFMRQLFYGVSSDDWSFLQSWETMSLTELHWIGEYSNLSDLKVLSDWNVSNVVNMSNAFSGLAGITKLDGLENWDVSSVTNMESIFSSDTNLENISALKNWDVSNVTTLRRAFESDSKILNLNGLEDWNVSSVTDLYNTFHQLSLVTSLSPLSNWTPKPTTMLGTFGDMGNLLSLEGLENFDTSNCVTMERTFENASKLLTIKGVETWDTSRVVTFERTFVNVRWVSDISFVADWSFASATNTQWMFGNVDAVLNVEDLEFDLSNVTSPQNMFSAEPFGYATELSQEIYKSGHFFYTYTGESYSELAISTFNQYLKDASNANNWTVSGTNLGIFSMNVWTGIPSWN